MPQAPSHAQLLARELKKFPGVDPAAAFAVAGQEGLSGGIGDGGHAFGPFQLNNAGGVITGRFQGQTPEQINAWAWSPEGIDYALQGVGKASAGQRGGQAVRSIVSKFERPQDPTGEISRSLASLGSGASAAPAAPMPSLAASPAGADGSSPTGGLLSALIGRTNQSLGLSSPSGASVLSQLLAGPQTAAATAPAAGAPLSAAGLAGSKFLSLAPGATLQGVDPQLVASANAFSRALGGGVSVTSGERTRGQQAALYDRYQHGGNIAAAPGTSNHEHGGALDLSYQGKPIGLTPAAKLLAKYGLHLSVPGDYPHVTRIGVHG